MDFSYEKLILFYLSADLFYVLTTPTQVLLCNKKILPGFLSVQQFRSSTVTIFMNILTSLFIIVPQRMVVFGEILVNPQSKGIFCLR